jgi:hypothetical protein
LNRATRRRLDRAVQGLMGGDGCSVCGAAFDHNSRIFGGCDGYGRAAVVGDCCSERLALVTHAGLYAARSYDFLHPRKREIDSRRNRSAGTAEITSAIAACRGWIDETDRQVDGMERRAGLGDRRPPINVLESAWKTADRLWFEEHPERSHRAHLVLPGEADMQAAKTPAGTVLLALVRQVEPGKRVRTGFFINAELWPAPEIEAVAHLLFDIATGQQAQPRDAAERAAMVEQYHAAGRGH